MLTDVQRAFLRALNDLLVEQGNDGYEHRRQRAVKLDRIPREGRMVVTGSRDETINAGTRGWWETYIEFRIYSEPPIESTAEEVEEELPSIGTNRPCERTAAGPSRQLSAGEPPGSSDRPSDLRELPHNLDISNAEE